MSNFRKTFWPFGLFWLLMGFALAVLLFLVLVSVFTLPLPDAVKPTPGGITEPMQAIFLG